MRICVVLPTPSPPSKEMNRPGPDGGGPHAGGDVVGAVGGVQEGLGARGDVPTVQEEATNLDTELRAARFAGEDVVHVRCGQQVGEDADLRRLADAVSSFEGDEQTGVGRGGGRLSHATSVAATVCDLRKSGRRPRRGG